MTEKNRQIFIDGKTIDQIKSDEKLEQFFTKFDDTIYRIAEKKFEAMCKKHNVKADLTLLIKFKED